jgi:DNA segregation ATPase FtsK/SpoIIIE-like protein
MENNELTAKQLLPKAIEILNQNLERDHCGISWMQRMLKIGYNKSCDLIDLLEDKGFIASPDQIGKREILKRN